MIRLITSPSQNTGIEMPISPSTMSNGSTNVPRMTAAAVPIAMPTTTQMITAPNTSESVTGAASVICGTTFAPRLTNEVRSRLQKSFFIMIAYCTGFGAVEAEVVAHLLQRLLARVAAGDARCRVDPGRREEDQEHEHAEREHHEDGREQAADDERDHRRPHPQPRARIERVAHAVAEHVEAEHGRGDREPGAIATHGRV